MPTIPLPQPNNQTSYKGELEGFPKEVVDWMLKQQILQGNKEDITVFEAYRKLCKAAGGFDWEETKEGTEFCDKVVSDKRFDIFFTKYPRGISENEKPTYPKIMRVSDAPINEKNDGLIRVVFMEKKGKYLAWEEAETFAEAEHKTVTRAWKYAKNIKPENSFKSKLLEKAEELTEKADELLALASELKEAADKL